MKQEVGYDSRKFGITLLTGVLLVFCSLTPLTFIFGLPEITYYWGLLAGLFPGAIGCYYIYLNWDPVNLRPKKHESKTSISKILGVILIVGIFFARLINGSFGGKVDDFIRGLALTVIITVLGYLIVVAWWYRPKSNVFHKESTPEKEWDKEYRHYK